MSVDPYSHMRGECEGGGGTLSLKLHNVGQQLLTQNPGSQMCFEKSEVLQF